MAENADNTSLSPAREARRAPSKRRASPISPDNESSQTRAVQRVAQPGEPRRDESTLDLFAGDPSYAPVQAVEADRRQGVSEPEQHEAEAVQVAATTDSAPADVALSRDTVCAEGGAPVVADAAPEFVAMTSASGELAAEAVVAVAAGGDSGAGLGLLEPAQAEPAQAEPAQAEPAQAEPAQAEPAQAEPAQAEPAQAEPAQAEPAQAEPAQAEPAAPEPAAPEPMLPGQALAQLREARAAGVPRPAKGGRSASRAVKADSAAAGGGRGAGLDQPPSEPENAARAEATSAGFDARQASPELTHAQLTPRADTIDALHNVIADQRRALTDLSRRMKWMLGAAVGALLVTVAAGVAQSIVLARLATDASAQQQRIAQMLQDQQASLAAMQARLLPSAGQPASPGIDRPVAPSPARRVQHAKRAHGTRSTAQ